MESIIGIFIMAILIVCFQYHLIKQVVKEQDKEEPKVTESEDDVMW